MHGRYRKKDGSYSVSVSIPEEAYERLELIAEEVGIIHGSKPSVSMLLEAISNLEPETVFEALEREDELPSRKYYPIQ
jgi:hypothetical protein